MKIQLKRSNVLQSGAAKEPTASQLEYGELAINYSNSDPAIFLKDSNNNIIRISGVGNIADDGLTNVPAGTTPPTNPTPESGNLWYNSDEGRLYIYYVDANTSQWVDASPDSWDPTVMPVTTNPAAQTGTLDDRYVMENGDTMTGALLLDNAASASAPDLSFDGDANTGIYSPASDKFGIATAGLSRVVIDSSGNVGINIGSPQTKFHSSGTTNGAQATFGISNSGLKISTFQKTNNDAGVIFDAQQATNGTLVFRTAGSEHLRIDSSGNVGIGQSNPSGKLEVNGGYVTLRSGASSFPDGISAPVIYGSIGGGSGTFDQTGNLVLQTRSDAGNYSICMVTGDTPTERLRIDSSGNVGIGNANPEAKLHVAYASGNPQIIIERTTSSTAKYGLHAFSNTFTIRDQAQNQERLRIDSSGNVGIGTVSPSQKLDVSTGYLNFTDNYGIRWGGATSTAFYGNSAGNFIGFQTGTNERMRIDSLGRVGVGTISPSAPMHVKKADISTSGLVDGLRLQQGSATNGNRLSLTFGSLDNFTVAGVNGVIETHSGTEANNVGRLEFYTKASGSSVAERMRIDNSGRVGIGASSPSDLLHVRVNASGDQSVLRLSNANATQGNTVGINFAPANDIVSVAIKAIAEDSHNAVAERDGALGFFTRLNGGSITEKARIDSSGNLMLGTTTPGAGGGDELTLATSGQTGITIRSGTTSKGAIYFADGTSGDSRYRGYFEYDHNGDYLRIGTADAERLRILGTGGLTFNGDTATANALNDYEEGYFTPTLSSGGTPGSTLTVNRSRYIKIGRQCTIMVEIVFVGGDNGSFRLTNLPFNLDSTGSGGGQPQAGISAVGSVLFNNLNITGLSCLTTYFWANTIYFYYTPATDGATWTEITGSQVGGNTGGGNLIFSATYNTV